MRCAYARWANSCLFLRCFDATINVSLHVCVVRLIMPFNQSDQKSFHCKTNSFFIFHRIRFLSLLLLPLLLCLNELHVWRVLPSIAKALYHISIVIQWLFHTSIQKKIKLISYAYRIYIREFDARLDVQLLINWVCLSFLNCSFLNRILMNSEHIAPIILTKAEMLWRPLFNGCYIFAVELWQFPFSCKWHHWRYILMQSIQLFHNFPLHILDT